MNGAFFHSYHSRLITALLSILALIFLFSSVLAFFGPPVLPLWYSITLSEEQLAPRIFAFSIPVLASGITVFSLWFGRKTHLEHEHYLATISLWSGACLLTLLLIAVLRIVKVVL